MITPWNYVQLIGCGVIIANTHQQTTNHTEEEHAKKFTVDNRSKATPTRSPKNNSHPMNSKRNWEVTVTGTRMKRWDSIYPARIDEDNMDDDTFFLLGLWINCE